MHIAGRTDVGQVRTHNEDNYCVGANFAVVADGMGGHNKGEVASSMVVELLEAAFSKDAFKASAQSIKKIIRDVNRAVYKQSLSESTYNGMGTTLVACIWNQNTVYVANIGDSRCYQITDEGILQITKDHTLIQKLLDDGQITKEEALHSPNRHVITKAIGTNKEEEADVAEIQLKENMKVFLCSDGLSNHVSDEKILEIVSQSADVDEAVERLVDNANSNGGTDNITAVLIQF
ncbi:MAG: Stp1/IreP family PP2C-type Ser/Thr phosphatase [Clostridia bacterium]|nr:Stp1/IreP family PP2C-type Ser/Thr phosphatase [Clostridia bacterium]